MVFDFRLDSSPDLLTCNIYRWFYFFRMKHETLKLSIVSPELNALPKEDEFVALADTGATES